jgi:DNA polymerase III alpha subunit (gram-positive type)
MSKEHLEKNGLKEEDALYDMVEFIMKHVDVSKPLYCLGHNLVSFDIPFFKDLLFRHEVVGITFAHRQLDTFALSMGTVQEHDSNTLFSRLGLASRGKHNALDDAKYSLEVYRKINRAWKTMLKQR